MRPQIVTSDDIDQHWHWIEPEFKRCIARNIDGFTVADARAEIMEDKSFVLAIRDDKGVLLMVSKIDSQPDALHVHLFSGYGMGKWLPFFMQLLQELCHGMGKKYFSSLSRPGMVRALRRWGKPHSVYMTGVVT